MRYYVTSDPLASQKFTMSPLAQASHAQVTTPSTISHLSGVHTKDPPSSIANADVETLRVSTFSTIFEEPELGEYYIMRWLLLKCIAFDSPIANWYAWCYGTAIRNIFRKLFIMHARNWHKCTSYPAQPACEGTYLWAIVGNQRAIHRLAEALQSPRKGFYTKGLYCLGR